MVNLGWLQNSKETLAGFGSGQTAEGVFQTIGGAGATVTYAVAFLMLIAMAFLFMRHLLMYQKTVYVFRLYGSGIKLLSFKGRHFKDKNGKYKFVIVKNLFQLKATEIPLVDQEFFIKQGKGEAVFLLQVAPGDYKPVGLMEGVKEMAQGMQLTILDQNAANHTLQVHREIVERHKNQSKLLLYLPTIMMVGGMIFVVVLLWMTLGRIETMNNAITTAATTVAEALRDAGKTVIN